MRLHIQDLMVYDSILGMELSFTHHGQCHTAISELANWVTLIGSREVDEGSRGYTIHSF